MRTRAVALIITLGFVFIVLVVTFAIAISLGGSSTDLPEGRYHFVCNQGGNIVEDVYTVSAPQIIWLKTGNGRHETWVWEREDGTFGVRTVSSDLSCQPEYLGE